MVSVKWETFSRRQIIPKAPDPFGSQYRIDGIVLLKGIQVFCDMFAFRFGQCEMGGISGDKTAFVVVKKISVFRIDNQTPVFIPADISFFIEGIQFFQQYDMPPVRHKGIVIKRTVHDGIGTGSHIPVYGVGAVFAFLKCILSEEDFSDSCLPPILIFILIYGYVGWLIRFPEQLLQDPFHFPAHEIIIIFQMQRLHHQIIKGIVRI